MKTRAPLRAILLTATAALGLFSCQTVNRLEDYRVRGAAVAVDVPAPPAPAFKINYSVTLDRHDPLGTAISIGTNLVKANEASLAEGRMREALGEVDVPGILGQETESACTTALGAVVSPERAGADFLLSLEIHEYGLEADSPWQGVRLFMRVTARLYHNGSGDLAWRRSITVDQSASPEMFGMGSIVGTIVTAASLSELSTEELAQGFGELARESARAIARRLEHDLD